MAFKIGALLNKANLKEAGMAALGGGLSGVAYDVLRDLDMKDDAGLKIEVFDKAWKKGALATGLALVGGGLVWTKSRSMAHGILGAMGAELTREIVAAVKAATAAAAGTSGTGSADQLAALAESQINYPKRIGGATLAGSPDVIRTRAVLAAVSG